MVDRVDTWGWYATGLSNSGGDDAETLSGNSYDLGSDYSFQEFGTMQMIDGDEDGSINDSDTGGSGNDNSDASNGDGFMTPDGVDRIVNEVVIYNDTVLTYTAPDGSTQTWTMDLVVWQLGNGDLVMRTTDDNNDLAPADFDASAVTNITLGTWDGTDYISGQTSNFDEPPPVVCFAAGTLIETDRGPVAVEFLKTGDLVLTKDAGLQPIRWIGSRKLFSSILDANSNLRPIRIKAGVLGEGCPVSDLIVSPQHRILVRSKIAQRMFGVDEVLVAAKQLLLRDGVDIADDLNEVEYYHFIFDDHQVVISNGAETESLYTGSEALKALGPTALEEIFAIFPELHDRETDERTSGARMLVSGRQGRKLVHRHVQNNKPLVAQSIISV